MMKNAKNCALIILSLLIIGCDSLVLEGGNNGGAKGENPLVTPRAIQITALNTKLMVNWTRIAPAQGHDPYYEVWFSTSPNVNTATKWVLAPPPSFGNLVSVFILGLTNDVPYYVWVKADYGSLGISDFCPMSVGIPVPPPEDPVLSVVGGESLLEVSWTADDHAYFYEVSYIQGSDSSTTPPQGAEKRTIADPPVVISMQRKGGLVITGLSITTHTVWVRAVNTAGESDYTRATGVPKTAETSAPPAPGTLTIQPGNGKLAVTWPACERASSYKIYYHTTNAFPGPTGLYSDTIAPHFGTATETIIMPASSNGTTYYVWVVAHNSAGDSSPSLSGNGKPAAPPAINFNNINFLLGSAQAEYIFSETNPPGPFETSGELWDRLTRRKETALGNLFCDASAWYVRTKHGQTFDFVFLNGGYLDQPLNKGAVTVGSIESIPPPSGREDYYTLITLRGPELKRLFDEAAAVKNMGRGGKDTGPWGMVSSEARYTIVYPYPPPGATYAQLEPSFYGTIKPGSVTINGMAPDFSAGATYRICTANYLAGGGDGYTAFIIAMRDYPGVADVRHVTVPIWKGVCEYIYDKGAIVPSLDGRVKQEGGGVMCE